MLRRVQFNMTINKGSSFLIKTKFLKRNRNVWSSFIRMFKKNFKLHSLIRKVAKARVEFHKLKVLLKQKCSEIPIAIYELLSYQ